MSYIDRSNGYKGITYGAAGIVGVLFAGKLMFGLLSMGAATSTQTPADIQKQLTTEQDSGPLFQTIAEKFPVEMSRLTTDLSARATRGEDHKAIVGALKAFMVDLSRDHLSDLGRAPHQELVALEQTRAAVLDHLQGVSPTLCARFDNSGVVLNELPVGQARALMSAMLVAQWRATAAGRDTPVVRQIDRLAPDDARALIAAMRRAGMSEQEYTEMRAQAPDADPNPVLWCNVAVHTARAIQALPADQGDRIMAWSQTSGAR